jgi:hypothetical protein
MSLRDGKFGARLDFKIPVALENLRYFALGARAAGQADLADGTGRGITDQHARIRQKRRQYRDDLLMGHSAKELDGGEADFFTGILQQTQEVRGPRVTSFRQNLGCHESGFRVRMTEEFQEFLGDSGVVELAEVMNCGDACQQIIASQIGQQRNDASRIGAGFQHLSRHAPVKGGVLIGFVGGSRRGVVCGHGIGSMAEGDFKSGQLLPGRRLPAQGAQRAGSGDADCGIRVTQTGGQGIGRGRVPEAPQCMGRGLPNFETHIPQGTHQGPEGFRCLGLCERTHGSAAYMRMLIAQGGNQEFGISGSGAGKVLHRYTA